MPDVKTFETYFDERGEAAEPQPDTGDYKLVWRSDVVYKRLDVDTFAAVYMADNVTTTTITVLDDWEAIGGTLLSSTLADVWSLATNQLTYAGPTLAKPSLIQANCTLSKAGATTEDYEIGIFANDVLIQNSIGAQVITDLATALSCTVLFALTVGDVIDIRVRNRSGTEDVIVVNAQLVIA